MMQAQILRVNNRLIFGHTNTLFAVLYSVLLGVAFAELMKSGVEGFRTPSIGLFTPPYDTFLGNGFVVFFLFVFYFAADWYIGYFSLYPNLPQMHPRGLIIPLVSQLVGIFSLGVAAAALLVPSASSYTAFGRSLSLPHLALASYALVGIIWRVGAYESTRALLAPARDKYTSDMEKIRETETGRRYASVIACLESMKIFFGVFWGFLLGGIVWGVYVTLFVVASLKAGTCMTGISICLFTVWRLCTLPVYKLR
jgi:hypothetical protein